MIGAFVARYQPEWLERIRLGAPLWIGPTGELALGIHHRWEARRYFVQFTCYMDESGTHAGADYMMIAGLVARLGQWNRFDHKWTKHLKKSGIEHFHSADLRYRGTPEKEMHFFSKCGKLIEENTLFGFTIHLRRDDFQKAYVSSDKPKPRKVRLDTMFGLCFRTAFAFATQLAAESDKRSAFKVNFIPEDGHKNIGDAIRVFKELREAHIAGISEYLGECTPAPKRKYPGLQAADAIAYGGWQQDAITPPLDRESRPRVDSAEVMRGTPALKSPIFRLVMDEPLLSALRERGIAAVEARKRFGELRRAKVPSSQKASGEQPS